MKYLIILALVFSTSILASQVKMNIIDMGSGLCTVTKMSNGEFVVFDAGLGKHCANKIKQEVKSNPISLLIISHADYDHFGGAKYLLNDMNIKTVLHTGFKRKNVIASYTKLLEQITLGAKEGRFEEINLSRLEEYRNKFEFGESSVQIVGGYGHNHYGFNDSEDSHVRNSISIAAKFQFDNKSILITGDAKGKDSEEGSCLYAEKEMVDHKSIRPIKSDVLIAGHHGANDTSANCFLNAVKPEFVIYSAGNKHGHPRTLNAQRVIASGVKLENIFRTDRGSDEQGSHASEEWEHDTQVGCKDTKGDDAISVLLIKGSAVKVDYISPENVCK